MPPKKSKKNTKATPTEQKTTDAKDAKTANTTKASKTAKASNTLPVKPEKNVTKSESSENKKVGDAQTEIVKPRRSTKSTKPNQKKRGRKKKNPESDCKPEDVLDYIQRNYPGIEIEKIRDSVIEGMKKGNNKQERMFALDEIKISGETYYCDTDGNILNSDAKLCGFFNDPNDIEKNGVICETQDGQVRATLFNSKSDDRTFKQVMMDIAKNHTRDN